MAGIVVGKKRLLLAVLADHLAEIALLVQQAYPDHRDTQFARGLELVASHVAQPARVDGQGFAQHEFHAEIGDALQWRLRMILLKPARRGQRAAPVAHKVGQVGAKA